MSSQVITITQEHATTQRNYAPAAFLVFATLLGLYVRILPALSTDFPLNDGGLFYQITQDIQNAHYALPSFTSYNSAGIPLAYPPLSFYLAALLADVSGWSLIDIVRLLPPVLSALTVPAVMLLSRTLLSSWVQASLAAIAFALVPSSFEWLIMGGGLARATGILFAVLALSQVSLLYIRGNRQFVLSSALFIGCTFLSHPEVTWFLSFSIVLLFLFFARTRHAAVHSLFVGAGVLLVTAPWWLTIILRHGVAPFIAALGTGSHTIQVLIDLIKFNFTGEPYSGLLAILGLLGIFVCFADRRFFLPAWLMAILVLAPRSGSTYATIPLAMLIALSVDRLVLPGISRMSEITRAGAEAASMPMGATPQHWSKQLLPKLALGYFFIYALMSAWSMPTLVGPILKALPKGERDAMAWIAASTPKESRFIALTMRNPWEDSTSEWFPVLAQRTSLATQQGTEWIPDLYLKRTNQFVALQACAMRDVDCLTAWSGQWNAEFTHVYVRKATSGSLKTCCSLLERSLNASSAYALVYDGPGAMIFEARTPKSNFLR